MKIDEAKNVAAKLHRQMASANCKIVSDETCESEVVIVSFLNFTDLVRAQMRCLFRSERFTTEAGDTTCTGVEYPCENSSQIVFSSDGKKRLIHTVSKDDKGTKDFFEVQTGNDSKVFALSIAEKHGDVCAGALFSGLGGVSFSPSGKMIAYTAEKKAEKKYKHFSKEIEADALNEYSVKDNWGEALEKHSTVVLSVLDTETSEITVLDFLDEGYSYKHPAWISEDRIVVIGTRHGNFRLGLTYCQNRECAIFEVSLQSKSVKNIGLPTAQYTGVFVSPDKTQFLTVSNPPSGPHMQDQCLLCVDSASFSSKKILSDVFIDSIPDQPWVDETHFCLNLFFKSSIKGVVVDLASSDLQFVLQESQYEGSYMVRDFCKGWFAVVKTSFTSPECLMAVKHKSNTVKRSKYHMQFDFFVKKIEFEDWGYYFIGPSDQSMKRPCILFPHGGPHVSNADAGNLRNCEPAFLVSMGVNCVLINYRGSSGFTPASLRALPGHVGNYDVADCMKALEAAVKCKDWNCDPDKVGVMGGSHGGFLSLHLIGQHPEVFKVCVARNPVTNIGSMASLTDIPDWCYYEVTTETYDRLKIGDPEFYKTAFEKSPISHVHKVITPTQFHIGLKDRRVPAQQTKEYFRALRGFGKAETSLLEFPEDSHPLKSPEASANHILEAYLWVCKHLNIVTK